MGGAQVLGVHRLGQEFRYLEADQCKAVGELSLRENSGPKCEWPQGRRSDALIAMGTTEGLKAMEEWFCLNL